MDTPEPSFPRPGRHRIRLALTLLLAITCCLPPSVSTAQALPPQPVISAPAAEAEARRDTAPLAEHGLVDQGEYYWADGQKISLQRRADQVVVKQAADLGTLAAEAGVSLAAPMAGATVVLTVTPGLHIFATGDLTATGILDHAAVPRQAEESGVAWMAPVYQAGEDDGPLVVADELIVALQPGVTADAFFAGDSRFLEVRPLPGTPDQFIATVAAGGGVPTLALANALQEQDPRVRWASPNLYQEFRPHFLPNDGFLTFQWHLNNTGQLSTTVDADADIAEAWDITTGSPNVVIAIVDDGVQLDHPDLAANIFVNPGEIAANGLDDDGNGWIDDVNGWDFAQNDNNPTPTDSNSNHGTPVAGVAAAVGNNGLGVAGVAYQSRIMPIRIINNGVFASDAVRATALYYAGGRTANGLSTWRGADVINNSWGGGAPSTVFTEAARWASSQGRGGKGTPISWSTGNDSSATPDYPSSLAADTPGIIAVGASTDADVRAGYSNYGFGLDLVAPSGGGSYKIGTTDRTGAAGYSNLYDYIWSNFGFSGTSSAAPLAAGVAALLLAADGNLTAGQIKALLRSSADKIGPLPYVNG